MIGRAAAAVRAMAVPAVAVPAVAALAVAVLCGCGEPAAPAPDPVPAATRRPIDPFVDVTTAAGIDFVHDSGASPDKLLPETMGAGVAWLDYDRDGRPDLYLVNGGPLTGAARGRPGALYRNRDGSRFEDVTVDAGLDVPLYGMGAAAGDYDGDGYPDLYVTGVGGDRLFHNRGDGGFDDVTDEVGLGCCPGLGSSAAWLDYDRDGDLDLFAGRYVAWSAASDITCTLRGGERSYCTPERYQGQSNRLFRNRDGRFEDVSHAAGVDRSDGKTLGVVVFDHDRDGWPDIAIANDTVRNFLFVNRRDGTFREAAIAAEIAYSESGATRGGMGIDAADFDRDGHADLVIGNFFHEMVALYRGAASGAFVDDAAPLGVGLPTLTSMAFGTLFVDYDSDGWPDILIANGHIEPDIARARSHQSHAQLPQLFRNVDGARFDPAIAATGPLAMPLVGRGLATADFDGDGDLDVALTQNGGAAKLWRNDARPRHWLRVRLRGTASNRDGYGAVVRVVRGEERLERYVSSACSYLSACEAVATFGLGRQAEVDAVEVDWPSGRRQRIAAPAVNAVLTVTEPDGS